MTANEMYWMLNGRLSWAGASDIRELADMLLDEGRGHESLLVRGMLLEGPPVYTYLDRDGTFRAAVNEPVLGTVFEILGQASPGVGDFRRLKVVFQGTKTFVDVSAPTAWGVRGRLDLADVLAYGDRLAVSNLYRVLVGLRSHGTTISEQVVSVSASSREEAKTRAIELVRVQPLWARDIARERDPFLSAEVLD